MSTHPGVVSGQPTLRLELLPLLEHPRLSSLPCLACKGLGGVWKLNLLCACLHYGISTRELNAACGSLWDGEDDDGQRAGRASTATRQTHVDLDSGHSVVCVRCSSLLGLGHGDDGKLGWLGVKVDVVKVDRSVELDTEQVRGGWAVRVGRV